MRHLFLLAVFFYVTSGYAQNPLSQIEGFLEVSLSTDTTSLYIGKNAGQKIDLTNPRYNVFLGTDAGRLNSTGRRNVFLGFKAGVHNSSGGSNVYIGHMAGVENISGDSNVFIGQEAGEDNLFGRDNVFVGEDAGNDSKGSYNTLIGSSAGEDIDSTEHNTCLGYQAGDDLEGNYNTYLGSNSGEDAEAGDYNIALGYEAGYNNQGSFNSILGSLAGYNNHADKNIFVGHESGYTNFEGRSNSFLGYRSGYNNDDGSFNSFFGNEAGVSNIDGSSNVFMGSGSGKASKSGNNQVYIGNGAGSSSRAGLHSICIGSAAGLFDTLLNSSVYIGHNAGALSFSNQGSRSGNVFLGNFAGYNHKGSNKLFISNSSVDSTEALVYGEFDNNVLRVNADLHIAANNSTTGNSRILMKGVGGALNEVIRYDGDENDVVMGSVSGAGGKLHLRANSDTKMSIIENGNVGIGITDPSATLHVDGTVKISVLPPLPGTNDLRYTSNGIIARSSSDQRLKTDILTLQHSLERVLELRGVSYVWKDDKKTGRQIGMIAQEVKNIVPEIVNQGEDGFYSIDYTETIGLLVEAIKEQQVIIDRLEQERSEIRLNADIQSSRMDLLEDLIKSLID